MIFRSDCSIYVAVVCCLIIGLFQPSLQAQVFIKGTIYDQGTGQPIEGVTIDTEPESESKLSDENGGFELSARRPLREIRFSHSMYESQVHSIAGVRDSTFETKLIRRSLLLSEVLIEAFNSRSALIKTAGSIEKITTTQIEVSSATTLAQSLNLLPGVSYEERGQGGSRRISIRGSSFRSPFAVRNLKMYWNGVPLSSPDGSSPVELVEPTWVDAIEVIKGPASSLYGAGTGGVLLFQSKPVSKSSIEQQVMFGSYGLRKFMSRLDYSKDRIQTSLAFVNHHSDGYREQEFLDRNQLWLNSGFQVTDKDRIEMLITHYRGEWGLPGAISDEMVHEDPTQSEPFSVEADARLKRIRTRIGLTWKRQWTNHWNHHLTVFGNFTSKENPYGTSRFFNGYKREHAQGAGLRSLVQYQNTWNRLGIDLTIGTEYSSELNQLRDFKNVQGEEGELKADHETRSTQGLAFVQSGLNFSHGFKFSGGLSYNYMRFEHLDLFRADSIDFTADRQFDPVFSPRFTLLQTFKEAFSLYSAVSWGFSPPALFDLYNSDGTLNPELKPESAITYELGAKGSLLDAQLNFQIAYYNTALTDAILPITFPDGLESFDNAGKIDQQGVELSVSHQFGQSWRKGPEVLRPWLTYAFIDTKFDQYTIDDENFAGNKMPGVSPHRLNLGFDIVGRTGLYSSWSFSQVSAIHLNNANTEKTASYQLLAAKIGYKRQILSRLNVDLSFGADNITNASYTSFLRINGFGGKYYNPSPARNFFANVTVGVDL